jgi:hypothetical protein
MSRAMAPADPWRPAIHLDMGVIVVIYLQDDLIGLAAEHRDSVEQTMEALSRDLERLRRQLIERRAS